MKIMIKSFLLFSLILLIPQVSAERESKRSSKNLYKGSSDIRISKHTVDIDCDNIDIIGTSKVVIKYYKSEEGHNKCELSFLSKGKLKGAKATFVEFYSGSPHKVYVLPLSKI